MPLERIKELIVTDEDLLFVINTELELIQDFCTQEKLQNLAPILKIIDSNSTMQLAPLMEGESFNKSTERRRILQEIGAHFRSHWGREVFPAIVMLTSEAWLKAFEQEKPPQEYHRAPSDYPDAIDTIVVQAITLVKSSPEDEEGKPRAGMGVLEIKNREPYIHTKSYIDPRVFPVSPNNTDLLNHFFLGWFKQGLTEQN